MQEPSGGYQLYSCTPPYKSHATLTCLLLILPHLLAIVILSLLGQLGYLNSLLCLIASLPERLHFLRSICMCGEAHKGILLIIMSVAQPLVVLGHVTEGPCDKWKMTTFK